MVLRISVTEPLLEPQGRWPRALSRTPRYRCCHRRRRRCWRFPRLVERRRCLEPLPLTATPRRFCCEPRKDESSGRRQVKRMTRAPVWCNLRRRGWVMNPGFLVFSRSELSPGQCHLPRALFGTRVPSSISTAVPGGPHNRCLLGIKYKTNRAVPNHWLLQLQ